jgi:hypothetical protein
LCPALYQEPSPVQGEEDVRLVNYAGDTQGFAQWARLSSESVAAWEVDEESVTDERAALIESRLKLPVGCLQSSESMTPSLTANEVIQVEPENPVATRRANLQFIVDKVGSKIALTTLTGIAASNLSKVFKKDFTDYFARKIEKNMQIEEGSLDSPHDAESWEGSIPQEVLDKLNQLATERRASGTPGRNPLTHMRSTNPCRVPTKPEFPSGKPGPR